MEFIDSVEDKQLIQTFFDASPEDVIELTDKIVVELLQQLVQRKEPTLSVVSRSTSNAVFCKKEHQLRLCLGTVKRRLSDGKRFQGLIKVLQMCYTLRKEKKSANQRELYYMNTDIFSSQRECDECIQDCIALLRVPRDALGISATAKGYVTGRLLYSQKNSGNWSDMAFEKPQSISYEMVNTLDVKSDAQLILIVEKMAFSNGFTKTSFSILFHASSLQDEDFQTWQHEPSLTFL